MRRLTFRRFRAFTSPATARAWTADGYFWLMGRVDDVINVSGHRLGTMEIESALVAHPKVAEAAVVGRPDEMKGQAIAAFVSLEEGHEPSEALKQELRQWVAKEIGALARPDDLRFTQMLPKTRSGQDHAAAAAGACDDRRSEGRYDDAGGFWGGGEAEGERGVANGLEASLALAQVIAGVRGQREVEGGAFAERAGRPDVAAVLRDDAAADGEAEAGAAHGAGVGGVDLLEAVEDLLQLVFGDAAALVVHFDERFVGGDERAVRRISLGMVAGVAAKT